MAKIERYETKLSVMAFIGIFDDLMGTVMPVRLFTLPFFLSCVTTGIESRLVHHVLRCKQKQGSG